MLTAAAFLCFWTVETVSGAKIGLFLNCAKNPLFLTHREGQKSPFRFFG
jgi:hypothetical protein